MYLRGMTQYEIAQRVGVSQTQISFDMAAVREGWKKRATAAFQERLNEQVERLEYQYREAAKVWEESRRPREVKDKTTGRMVMIQPQGNLHAHERMEKITMAILRVMGALKGDTTVNVTQVKVTMENMGVRPIEQQVIEHRPR